MGNTGIPNPELTAHPTPATSSHQILGTSKLPGVKKSLSSLCHSGEKLEMFGGLSLGRCLTWRCSAGTAPGSALDATGQLRLSRQGTEGTQCLPAFPLSWNSENPEVPKPLEGHGCTSVPSQRCSARARREAGLSLRMQQPGNCCQEHSQLFVLTGP